MGYDYDRRVRTAVRWENQANGTSYSLRWNKTKWQLEETVDGSPIPSLRNPGEGPEMAVYEMPTLTSVLSRFDTTVGASPYLLMHEAHFRVDDKGSEVRAALVKASVGYLHRAEAELRKEQVRRADELQRIIQQVTPKLKWKKVG